MNILVEVGNFGIVSTNDKSSGVYYLVKFVSITYKMQYETIINLKKLFSEIVVNKVYLTKLRLESNNYTKTDSTEVVIPLRIIAHAKINVFLPKVTRDFLDIYV